LVTAAAAACLVGLGAGSPTAHADDHSYLAAMDNRD
jgi:hypothetical protein